MDANNAIQPAVILSMGDTTSTSAMVREVQLPPGIPVLIDTGEKLKTAWGVTGTPVTVVVDEEFKVIQQIVGLAPHDILTTLSPEPQN